MGEKTEGSNTFYLFKLIKSRIKNGLILYSISNLMTRIGLDIYPYYWVQEGGEISKPPNIKDNVNKYSFESFDLDDVKQIASTHVSTRLPSDSLIDGFKKGQLCIGLKYNENIAAFMFIELNALYLNKHKIELKNNEAYLLNMHTYESYRGKNLAPYLRYRSYELLREKKIDTIYSITEYFNKSSYKFKKKLNAKVLKFYLSVTLFKKYHKTFIIKDYSE